MMKVTGWIPMSSEVIEDGNPLAEFIRAEMEMIAYEMLHGPRLRPGRRELYEVLGPQRRAAELRRALREMGRPAGPYVRTSRIGTQPIYHNIADLR